MPKPVRAGREEPTAVAPQSPSASTARPIVAHAGPTTLGEFLSLDEVELRVIELRVGLVLAVRRLRRAAGLTQAAVAQRLGLARTRVAEMESPSREPTLDSLIPLFFAVGGTTDQLCELVKETDISHESVMVRREISNPSR